MTKHARSIDLNCDLGEIPRLIEDGTDQALMACISSANVACGGHAGDAASMEATVRAALRHGVAIGAHPSYPDREQFGRRELTATPEQVEAFVREQVLALGAAAARLGARLVHVKPHGALYHVAGRDAEVARAIGRAVQGCAAELQCAGGLRLVGQAGSSTLEVWRGMGLAVVAEAFADRRYEADGRLRSRRLDDALIVDPKEAARQAVRIARGEGAVAVGGAVVQVHAQSICVHGDSPGAMEVARAVRDALKADGFAILARS